MTKQNEPTRRCPVCKAPMALEMQNYKAVFGEEAVLVEDVPTWVCDQCGETAVDDDVIEAVEEMLAELADNLATRDLPEIDISE